jgi:hypothetical protein
MPLTGWGPRQGYPASSCFSDTLDGGVVEGYIAMTNHQARESQEGDRRTKCVLQKRGEAKAEQVGSVPDVVDMKRKKRKTFNNMKIRLR